MKTKKLHANLLATVLFALLAISFTSCDKDDDEVSEPTKSEIISKAIWNWDKVEVYEDGTLSGTELYTGYKMEFKSDHTFTIYKPDGSIDEGGMQWDLNMDETKLIITEGEDGYIFGIQKLDDDEFIFYYEIDNTNPPAHNKLKFNGVNVEKRVFYLSR